MTKDEVYSILKNAEDYVSGEKISSQLGVTRAAVIEAMIRQIAAGYLLIPASLRTRHGFLGQAPAQIRPGLDLDEKDNVVLSGYKVDLILRKAIIARDYPEASFFQLPCGQILPQLSPFLRLGLRRGLRRRKFCGELASDQVFVVL